MAKAKIRVSQQKEELLLKIGGSTDANTRLMDLGLNISEFQSKSMVINSKFEQYSQLVEKQSQTDTLHKALIPVLQQQLLEIELAESKMQNTTFNVKSISGKMKKLLESKNKVE